MPKKVSIQLIANRLGLSKYAVSRALSGKRGVSEETRRKILETAKALGYRAKAGSLDGGNGSPASPNGQNPFVLIWIHPLDLNETTFWNLVVAGIVNSCDDIGWDHLIVSQTDEDREFSFPSYADRSSCVGIIVTGKFRTSLLLSMKKSGLPVILAEHEEPLADLDSVINDSYGAARSMCRRLISFGCRSILFVGIEQHSVSFEERWRGCQFSVWKENEMRQAPISLAKVDLPPHGSRLEQLEQLAAKQIETGLPDCFICANDYLALILLDALKKHGCAIPKQCKVVGFDNIDRSSYSTPPLTTVDLCKELLGYRSVQALQWRVDNPGKPPEKIVLSSTLVSRQSG